MAERQPRRSFELPYRLIGYICHYRDENDNEFQRQRAAVSRTNPHYMVFDEDVVRIGRSYCRYTNKRKGLAAVHRGIMPGDILVISSLDRLGVWPRDVADALLMFRSNEIRVLDLDPDGTHEWRPAIERTMAAMVHRQDQCRPRQLATIEARKQGRLFRGVGWTQVNVYSSRFEELPGPRVVANKIVALRDAGETFRTIATKLRAEHVLYVGCFKSQTEQFTAELTEECYHAARNGFPYPTPIVDMV